MPPVPEAIIKRIEDVEKAQIKQELNTSYTMEMHAGENRAMFAALQTRIEGVEQEQKAYQQSIEPILAGINSNLETLVGDKTKRDAIAEEESKKKPRTPWNIFKVKLIEGLATLISGGMIAGVIWIIVQMAKGS